jgi:hypothetical protein
VLIIPNPPKGLFGFDFLQLFGGETQESARIPPNGLRFCGFCSPRLLYAARH